MDVTSHAVYVAEGNFGLLDDGEVPADTADWSNGFVAVMAQGALIATGTHTGHVRVQAIAEPQRPDSSPANEGWDEIIEVTVHAPKSKLKIESLEKGPVAGLPALVVAGVSTYRVRVHARGREAAFDQVHEDPVEDYLVQVWPADTDEPPTIIRSSNSIERSLRTLYTPPEPVVPQRGQGRQEQLRQRLLRGSGRQQ